MIAQTGRLLSLPGARFAVREARSERGEAIVLKHVWDTADDEGTARLAHEAAALRFLEDLDGVVRLRGVSRGSIALEHAGGGTLAEWPMPRPGARAVALALARTVWELHARGVVHRDIKPSNVTVRSTGAPCLIDFDLAIGPGPLQAFWLEWRQDYAGTVPYAAPELLHDAHKACDRSVDTFGLGATLYQLLTGRPPFPSRVHGRHWREAHVDAVVRGVAAPSAVRDGIPDGLDEVLTRMLAVSPACRPDLHQVQEVLSTTWPA